MSSGVTRKVLGTVFIFFGLLFVIDNLRPGITGPSVTGSELLLPAILAIVIGLILLASGIVAGRATDHQRAEFVASGICPVCRGSGVATQNQFAGYDESWDDRRHNTGTGYRGGVVQKARWTKVQVPCTSCGGSGKLVPSTNVQ